MTSRGERNPADEIEALQAILLAELRRRPADLAALLRAAGALTKVMVAQGHLSPAKEEAQRRGPEQLSKYFKWVFGGVVGDPGEDPAKEGGDDPEK